MSVHVQVSFAYAAQSYSADSKPSQADSSSTFVKSLGCCSSKGTVVGPLAGPRRHLGGSWPRNNIAPPPVSRCVRWRRNSRGASRELPHIFLISRRQSPPGSLKTSALQTQHRPSGFSTEQRLAKPSTSTQLIYAMKVSTTTSVPAVSSTTREVADANPLVSARGFAIVWRFE